MNFVQVWNIYVLFSMDVDNSYFFVSNTFRRMFAQTMQVDDISKSKYKSDQRRDSKSQKVGQRTNNYVFIRSNALNELTIISFRPIGDLYSSRCSIQNLNAGAG